MLGLSSGTRIVSHLKEYFGEFLSCSTGRLPKTKTYLPEPGSNPWPAAYQASTLPLRHTLLVQISKILPSAILPAFGLPSVSQSDQIVPQKSSSSPSQPIRSNCLPKIIIITSQPIKSNCPPISKLSRERIIPLAFCRVVEATDRSRAHLLDKCLLGN